MRLRYTIESAGSYFDSNSVALALNDFCAVFKRFFFCVFIAFSCVACSSIKIVECCQSLLLLFWLLLRVLNLFVFVILYLSLIQLQVPLICGYFYLTKILLIFHFIFKRKSEKWKRIFTTLFIMDLTLVDRLPLATMRRSERSSHKIGTKRSFLQRWLNSAFLLAFCILNQTRTSFTVSFGDFEWSGFWFHLGLFGLSQSR